MGSGNIQNWVTVDRKTNLENWEWDDDPDLPTLEEIAVIERRENRRIEDREHDLLDNIMEQEGVVLEQYASLSAAGVVGGRPMALR